jgi:HEAT repeat protein
VRAVPPLIDALKDTSAKVRRNAIESLGYFPKEGKKIVPPLLERLGDNDQNVRRAAVLSLGDVGKGSPEVEQALARLAGDQDPVLRVNVVIAKGIMGGADESTLPVLLTALTSEDEMTAREASRVLGDLGSKNPDAILPQVTDLLGKGDGAQIGNMVRVLRRMKEKAFPALGQLVLAYDRADQPTRQDIIETAVAMDREGTHAVEVLCKGMQDKDPNTRRDAVMAAMRFPAQADRFAEPLLQVLQDQDYETRILAVAAVKGSDALKVKALPQLQQLLVNDPDARVRRSVIKALSTYKPATPDVLTTLERGLKDLDFSTRMTVVTALVDVGEQQPDTVRGILDKALQAEREDAGRRFISSSMERLGPATAAAPKK